MKKLNIKEILKDNLRQIENELKYYAETQNQEMFFELFNDKLAIEKKLQNK